MGGIELIRLPNNDGMFIKGPTDYLPMQSVTMKKKNVTTQSMFLGRRTATVYSLIPDSIESVKVGEKMVIYQYRKPSYNLLGLNAQNAVLIEGDLGILPEKWVADEENVVTDDLTIRSFTPESGKAYALVHGIKRNVFLADILINVREDVYAFKW